ncbi:MAG: hypothetical protein H5T69_02215 [Chloroflexi bacterium]|nr:hypothetical protein [Chloroflexota bacterium]
MVSITDDPPLSRQQKRFLHLWLLALIIAFSPFKTVGQVSPFIFGAGLVLYVRLKPRRHLKLYGGLAFLLALIGAAYQAALPEFWLPNYALALVTFSSLLILLYDLRPLATPRLLQRVGALTAYMLWAQSLYGLAQAVALFLQVGTLDGFTGDRVWGTMAPPLDRTYLGTGTYFMILLSTLLLSWLAMTPGLTRSRILGTALVVLCWLAASHLHSYVYFALALAGASLLVGAVRPWRLLRRVLAWFAWLSPEVEHQASSLSGNPVHAPRGRRMTYGLALLAGLAALLFVLGPRLQPANFRRLPMHLANISIAPDAKYWKLRAVYNTLFELPKQAWYQPIIGLGPGQYASRAALIATGEHLRHVSVPLPIYSGSFMRQYIEPLLNPPDKSSLHFASSSWIALYGEVGALGVLSLLAVAWFGWRRFRQGNEQFPLLSLCMVTQILYLLLMGVQNVYWEYTQAVFPVLVTFKLCYDFLGRERPSGTSALLDPRGMS